MKIAALGELLNKMTVTGDSVFHAANLRPGFMVLPKKIPHFIVTGGISRPGLLKVDQSF
jgi:hypothetical protein